MTRIADEKSRLPRASAAATGLWLRGLAVALGCASVCALLPAQRAEAQQGSAVVFGTVDNVDGGAKVVDAVVTITGTNLPGEQITLTDAAGNFRVAGLPPGDYSMNIQADGFKPYNRTEISLHADASTRLNASLLPETLEAEEVVVTGRTPAVDVGSSSTGLVITSELTNNVPLSAPTGRGGAQRSFESVLDVVPGTAPDAFGVAAMGASSPENHYLLDGISVNSPAYGLLGTPLTLEFVDEVSVITGGYMPEYGQSTGAIVNAITKSGSNEYHGSVWGTFTPGALAGDPKRVQQTGNQAIETIVRLKNIGDVGADVGGPIIKDRLWFYGGFQWARTSYDLIRKYRRTLLENGDPVLDADGNPETRFIPGTKETFVAQQDMLQPILKLTSAVNKKNRLDLTYTGVYPASGGDGKYGINPLTGLPEISTFADQGFTNTLAGEYGALAHEYLGDSTNLTTKLSSQLNDETRIDTWVGWHREHSGRLPADGSHIGDRDGFAGQSNIWYTLPHELNEGTPFPDVPACNRPGECPVSDYRIGGPEFINRMTMDRLQGRSILTRTFRALGHHTFKAGLDAEFTNYKHKKGYSGGRSVMEQDGYWLDGRVLGYLTGPDQPVQLPFLKNNSQSVTVGGFLQNSWSIVDQVTLNVGLRYDSQMMFANDELAMALHNQWSPRAGLIWDPTQEGRSRIFTNFARYYEKVPLVMLDRYLTGEPLLFAGRDSSVCDWGQPPGMRNCGDNSLLPFGIPPDNLYFPVGASIVPVDPDIKAPSNDEFVLGGDYEVYDDMRVGLTYTKRWQNRTIEDMSRDEAYTYFFGNPGYGIASDFPKAIRKYDALMFNMNKNFSDGWVANASYTVSWLRGNWGGLFRAEDLQFDPHQNSDFDLRSLTVNRNGWLPGDHRHAIKAFGAKAFKMGDHNIITPGASFRAYSGMPSNYLGGHPLYGAQQVFILERGSGERLPWNYSADVRLAYTYALDNDRTISVTMDIFNLFNFQNGIKRDESYTEATVEPVTGGGGLDDLTYQDGSPFDEADVNPNYGRLTRFQQPRTIRFGVKGTF